MFGRRRDDALALPLARGDLRTLIGVAALVCVADLISTSVLETIETFGIVIGDLGC